MTTDAPKVDKCDHCKETGVLGPELRAYIFVTPSGKRVVRLLHASDGGRDCYQKYDARYNEWLAEQRAKKAVGNG